MFIFLFDNACLQDSFLRNMEEKYRINTTNLYIVHSLKYLNGKMKNYSYAISLLLLVFLVSFAGTVGMASEVNGTDNNSMDPYDLKNSGFNLENFTGHKPEIEYPIFGYTNQNYTFSATCDPANFSNTDKIKVVFYWDTWRDTGKNNRTERTYSDREKLENGDFRWNSTHNWSENKTYGVQVAIFEGNTLKNLSYWMPVDIKPYLTPEKPHKLFMETEKCNTTYKYENESFYCGYEGQFYTFVTNANDPENERIWYYFDWGDGKKDYSEINDSGKPQSYSHSWGISASENKTSWHSRNFTIKTEAVKRNVYSKDSIESDANKTSILVIKDPGDFPIIGSFQNWGIFLITVGTMILFFARNSNDVPAEVSVPLIRGCCLKSRNTFIGIFLFFLGLYLYFVFRRAPWDIPIVNNFTSLKEAYFGLLYSEMDNFIPYLSLTLTLIFTTGISTAAYYAYISGCRYKAKNETCSIKKGLSSSSSKGKSVSKNEETPVGVKPGIEELITLIENENNPLILRQLYFIKFRYMGDSPEEAASRVGVTRDTGYLWENVWYKDGYEGLMALLMENMN